MDTLASQLKTLLSDVSVVAGDSLCWSPKTKSITYRKDDLTDDNLWGLLHEAGHAYLNHVSFVSDMELLQLEVEAWDAAVKIGQKLGYDIDHDHIQDCLDTYRDWLHQRSTCPRCSIVTFQIDTRLYGCYNCHNTWTVSSSRLCRPYRLGATNSKNRLGNISETVFQ